MYSINLLRTPTYVTLAIILINILIYYLRDGSGVYSTIVLYTVTLLKMETLLTHPEGIDQGLYRV